MKTNPLLLLILMLLAKSSISQPLRSKTYIDSIVNRIETLPKFYTAHEGFEFMVSDTSIHNLTDTNFKYADANGKNLVWVEERNINEGTNDTAVTFSTYYFQNRKLIKVFIQPLKKDSSYNKVVYFLNGRMIYKKPKRQNHIKYLQKAEKFLRFRTKNYIPNFIQ